MGNLSNWKAESGWDNPSLNANLAVDKDGNMYTTNFRSIYYDLESIPNAGIITMSMNVYTEYAFRVAVCGTHDSRNPMERGIKDDLWKTMLFHINLIPENGNIEIEPFFCYDDGAVVSTSANSNREYKIEIIIDHNRRLNGDEWIGLKITDPEAEATDVALSWFNPIPESEGFMPAQIRLIFKSKKRSRNIYRTFLKSFEIDYDEDATVSAEEKTEAYNNQVDNSVFRISNMSIDDSSLSLTDLISNISVISGMSSAKILFPIFKYNNRNIFDESEIKNLYINGNNDIMKYPDVPEDIKAEANQIAGQTNSRDKIVKHLLSLCGNATD